MSTAAIDIRKMSRASALLDGVKGLGPAGWIALGVLLAATIVALFGPLLASLDPNSVSLSSSYGPAEPGHLLGFDATGRDLFTRLVYGARTTLLGPLLLVSLATILGTTFALIAVWRGGWFDTVISRTVDAAFAFPGLLLAILVAAVFGAGLITAVLALTLAFTPSLIRIIRSAALKEKSLPYVAALQVQGVSGFTIAVRHMLPNLMPTITANCFQAFGESLIALASLSFIGLGVQAPTADWGAMVASGMTGVQSGHPQESLFAGLLIVVVVVAANLLGDRIVGKAVQL